MPKLHLILKKEDIDEEKIANKAVVVIDVLLATTAITSGLFYGARSVIPARDEKDAKKRAAMLQEGTFCLAGEFDGETIEGFLDPAPLGFKKAVKDKTMILATTNGTVAVYKARKAKKIYIASLLNGQAVAERISACHKNETVTIVCSGSSNQFCLEDFYGAGYLVNCLVQEAAAAWEMNDAAKAGLHFFRETEKKAEDILKQSKVGQMMIAHGLVQEIEWAAQEGALSIVPIVLENSIVLEEKQPF